MPEKTRAEKIEAILAPLRKTGLMYESAIPRIRTYINSQHAMTPVVELPGVILSFLETAEGLRMFNVEAEGMGKETSQIRTSLALFGIRGRAADRVIGEIGPELGDDATVNGLEVTRASAMARVIAERVEHDPLFRESWANRSGEAEERARAAVARAIAKGYIDARADIDTLVADPDFRRMAGGAASLADRNVERLMTQPGRWAAEYAPEGRPARRVYDERPASRPSDEPMPRDVAREIREAELGPGAEFADMAREIVGGYERM